MHSDSWHRNVTPGQILMTKPIILMISYLLSLILAACNGMVQDFIDLCDEIGVPISMEKMV